MLATTTAAVMMLATTTAAVMMLATTTAAVVLATTTTVTTVALTNKRYDTWSGIAFQDRHRGCLCRPRHKTCGE
jgi:hypothetical protein